MCLHSSAECLHRKYLYFLYQNIEYFVEGSLIPEALRELLKILKVLEDYLHKDGLFIIFKFCIHCTNSQMFINVKKKII